jgi:RNA polymerase sigma factor (sigma-70 family)
MKKAIQNNKTYTLNIYNHATGCFETVEVTEEVYRTYQRTSWSIENSDASFYAHEIQFSSLIGGSENAFQNFREFIDTENTPDRVLERKEMVAAIQWAIGSLSEQDQNLIYALFFNGVSEKDYAKQCGVKQQTVNKKKHRIFKKIKKFLDSWL